MDISLLVQGLRQRLESEREHFTAQEYEDMKKELRAAQKKPLLYKKLLLSRLQERLDQWKRRAVPDINLPRPPDESLSRPPRIVDKIVVDDRLWREMKTFFG